jgi:hypothetical protein
MKVLHFNILRTFKTDAAGNRAIRAIRKAYHLRSDSAAIRAALLAVAGERGLLAADEVRDE